jgi:hypothetical protein
MRLTAKATPGGDNENEKSSGAADRRLANALKYLSFLLVYHVTQVNHRQNGRHLPGTPASPPRGWLALWKRAHSEYLIDDVAGSEMLLQACQSLDRAESLRAQIKADGEVIRGRNGLVRSHPSLRDEIANRAFLVRTLSRLGLNFEPLRASPGRPPNVG